MNSPATSASATPPPAGDFKDKQALLNALALVGYDRMAEALEAADEPGLALRDRLTVLARTYLGFAIDNAEPWS